MKEEVSILFITCPKCKKDYWVGMNDKDLRGAQKSSGKLDSIPWIAVGNDEIEAAPKAAKSVKCHICGTLCQVKKASGDKR